MAFLINEKSVLLPSFDFRKKKEKKKKRIYWKKPIIFLSIELLGKIFFSQVDRNFFSIIKTKRYLFFLSIYTGI